MTKQVDFWFDPTCPFAWMTSRWMLEVEQVRDVAVAFHPMSLYILNEGRDLEPGYRAHIDQTFLASRLSAAVAEIHDQGTVRRFYTALGTRLHPQGQPLAVETLAAALAECELDAELIDRADSGEFDPVLRQTQQELTAEVGMDVGTPVIRVNGMALFGPVVSPAPRGRRPGNCSTVSRR